MPDVCLMKFIFSVSYNEDFYVSMFEVFELYILVT